jgi:hypothetical protein
MFCRNTTTLLQKGAPFYNAWTLLKTKNENSTIKLQRDNSQLTEGAPQRGAAGRSRSGGFSDRRLAVPKLPIVKRAEDRHHAGDARAGLVSV